MSVEDNYDELLTSGDESERKKAIIFLARNPTMDNLTVLKDLAESDESVEVRFFARKAVDVVKKSLKLRVTEDTNQPPEGIPGYPRNGGVRDKLSAIQHIIDNGAADSMPEIIDAMKSETDPAVLSAMLIVTGKFGGESEAGLVVPFLEHANPRVRANAIESLEMTGSVKVYPHIIARLDDEDNRVRANAVKALKNLGSANTLKILRAMVNSGRVSMQASAAYAFQFFPSEENAELLAKLYEIDNQSVKNNAIKSLKKFSEKKMALADTLINKIDPAAALFEDNLDNFEREIMSASKSAAGGGGKENAASPLEDPDPSRRLAAISSAMKNDAPNAGSLFFDLLKKEKDNKILATLIINLGRLQYRPSLPMITDYLGAADDRCRANAVEAIKLIDDRDALKKVVPLLNDHNNRVKANAIIALKGNKVVDTMKPLREMVASQDEMMQRSAFYTITELEDERCFELLLDLEKSKFKEVAANATGCINAIESGGNIVIRKKKGEEIQVVPAPAAAFKCETCGNEFKSAATLSLHQKTCSPGKARKSPDPLEEPLAPKTDGDMVKCPFCCEMIIKGALKCKHCGEFVQSRGAAVRPGRRSPGKCGEVRRGWETVVLMIFTLGIYTWFWYYMFARDLKDYLGEDLVNDKIDPFLDCVIGALFAPYWIKRYAVILGTAREKAGLNVETNAYFARELICFFLVFTPAVPIAGLGILYNRIYMQNELNQIWEAEQSKAKR